MKLELEEIYKTYFQDVYYFSSSAMSKDPPHCRRDHTGDIFQSTKRSKAFSGKMQHQILAVVRFARNEYISYARKKHRYGSGTDRTGIQ